MYGDVSSRSRDTYFLEDSPGRPRVVTIYGGKLTSYRACAEKLLAIIRKTLPAATPVADTRRLKLPVID